MRAENHKFKESCCCVEEPTYAYVYKSSVIINMVMFSLVGGLGYPLTLVDKYPMQYVGWGVVGFFGLWVCYGLHLLLDFTLHVDQGQLAIKTRPFMFICMGLGGLIIGAGAIIVGVIVIVGIIEYKKYSEKPRSDQDGTAAIILVVVFLISTGSGVIAKSKALRDAAEYITEKNTADGLEGPLVTQQNLSTAMERAK